MRSGPQSRSGELPGFSGGRRSCPQPRVSSSRRSSHTSPGFLPQPSEASPQAIALSLVVPGGPLQSLGVSPGADSSLALSAVGSACCRPLRPSPPCWAWNHKAGAWGNRRAHSSGFFIAQGSLFDNVCFIYLVFFFFFLIASSESKYSPFHGRK